MNLRRTRAVARKEFLHILRDRRSLIMALAVPLVMLLLFGYALTLDVDRIPTVIYDSDHSPESRDLIEQFRGSRYFQILGYVDEYGTIETGIDRDEILLGIVIPPDYSRNLKAGKEAEVQLILDGSDSNTASIALGYAEGLLRMYAVELRSNALNRKGGGNIEIPVEARLRVWYNSELKSKNYIVPGLIAVIMMIIAALLTSLTIAREWEMGTMEQLLSTPVRATELVLGKMVAFFAVGLIDMLVAIGIGVLVFRVPLRGNPLVLFFTGCVFLFGALCWGILLSALARSQLLAYQMGMVTSYLPAFLLSGFIYSIENMPTVIQVITYIVPARYFVSILKGVYLKGVGVEVLWVEVVFLLAYAAIVFLLATRKLKQKMA
ncbi:MAG: ABC transporter permease [Acidobacteria bacterium]|nr:ABC transporter permease [Acidobacteriota bacterium]